MSPKSFSERERLHIKDRLYEKGKEFLALYGVKKTSVEDITRAVGISKGAFYSFFNSKEEFFFDIFENHEKVIKKQAMEALASPGPLEVKLRNLIKSQVLSDQNSLFFIKGEDMEYLMRKLPPERLAEHLKHDDNDILTLLQAAGIVAEDCDNRVVSNVIKVIFFLRTWSDVINPEVLPETLDVLIDGLFSYIFKK